MCLNAMNRIIFPMTDIFSISHVADYNRFLPLPIITYPPHTEICIITYYLYVVGILVLNISKGQKYYCTFNLSTTAHYIVNYNSIVISLLVVSYL